MKRIVITLVLLLASLGGLQAQKFAFVDTEYILNKIPAYRTAQQQLEGYSKQYAQEVDAAYSAIQQKVKTFQSESVLLTPDMRQKRQQEIVDDEQKAKDLQQKYFGREGLLMKKQEELLKPIQDQVFKAVKELAADEGYAAIFDVASSASILYSSARYDKSDDVLAKMGY